MKRFNLQKTFKNTLATVCTLCAISVYAQPENETISLQFTQSGFGQGGVARLFVSGQDLDGDGRLYSMGGFGTQVIGYPAGDEVEYIALTLEEINGRTWTQRYDRNVAGATAEENGFFGFAYNLDGGAFADDPDEGISFSPLAPSMSMVAGELFSPFISPIPFENPLVSCGQPENGSCSVITALVPSDGPGGIDITFADFSAGTLDTSPSLRFSFQQSGFPGGASVHGTITGQDLNGDGRLTSMSTFLTDAFGYPAGDEVESVSVTIEGFDGGQAVTHIYDRSVAGIDDPTNTFFGVSYDLDGGELGDSSEEGLSLAPLAPSTSYVIGEIFSPLISPVPFADNPLTACDGNGGSCAVVVSLVPGEAFPDVDVTFSDFSGANVATAPDPDRIRAAHSGSWYDRERSGEGIVMHILPDSRVLMYWMTYDGNGAQRWFVGTGRIEGMSAVFDNLVVTSGGIFGAGFDPDAVALSTAGSARLEFDGCDAATLSYQIDGEEGSLNLIRLSAVSKLSCHP